MIKKCFQTESFSDTADHGKLKTQSLKFSGGVSSKQKGGEKVKEKVWNKEKQSDTYTAAPAAPLTLGSPFNGP